MIALKYPDIRLKEGNIRNAATANTDKAGIKLVISSLKHIIFTTTVISNPHIHIVSIVGLEINESIVC